MQTAVGQRLAGIAAKATAAQQSQTATTRREPARWVAAAGVAARDAITRAREGDGPASRVGSGKEPAAPVTGGAVIGARLAWAVLVVVLWGGPPRREKVGYVVFAQLWRGRLTALAARGHHLLVVALQLHHSGQQRGRVAGPGGGR